MENSVKPECQETLTIKKDGIVKVMKLINSFEKNQKDKAHIALLVNSEYQLSPKDSIRKKNNKLYKRSIARYVYNVYKQTQSVESFKKNSKFILKSGYVLPQYKRYFMDVRGHFLIKAFAREIS